MLKLGSLTLDVPFFQAPLSGYTDFAMRRLALDFGCPLTFAGVILAKTAMHPKVFRKPFFKPRDDEHPIGAQILGTDPQMCATAAREIVKVGYDIVDINFACPAPKVLRRGRGGALLKDADNAIEIYRRVREAVNCPVTVKLRTSFNSDEQTAADFYRIVEELSSDDVDGLVIHPRSVKQMFSGQADWSILAELKKQYPRTTIIGSGDLFDAETAVEKMRQTNVDGLLIARGAIGNPWIFADLCAIFKDKPKPSIRDMNQQREVILKHFNLISQLYKPRKAVGHMRKFLVNYCKFHHNRKKVQLELFAIKDADKLVKTINLLFSA